ncbi:hypothetical protein [Georgenia daeguensis]|uniref:Peptidase M6-like domain-containing protein n=1 Tax=Georgenia daeguensis TaxID=908355 RepID=A0ABP8EXR4_9MICO
MSKSVTRAVVGASAAALALAGLAAPAAADHSAEPPADLGSAGDAQITVPINDSAAGGTYYQPFELAYDGATADGTPVYVYVPVGALEGAEGVHSLDPSFDHNPDDEFVPCADRSAEDYELTQAQIDYLGDTLADQIVQVNEEHFGEMGPANPDDPASDSLVTLVYNVQDDFYYDCSVTSYTAGYFAPDFMTSLGMNVIVLDALEWDNRVGEDPSDAPWSDGDPANDRPELYEGVIAHELEHLLMNYSDAGELSWVDEGLADMAAFLNGFDMTGSHLTYQQVFHRETSLTRWGGGLENYGASFSYFAYLWEQAGGNGGGDLTPDLQYDDAAGDLLIKLIFAEEADSMEGVQNAIDEFIARTGADLASAAELFQDWAVTMYLDDEDSALWDLENFDLGPASGGWTIDIANDEFWDDRGSYIGSQPEAKWDRLANRPAGDALPFGVSYEKFRNPGPSVSLDFEGEASSEVAPHSGATHWWGGYASQSDTVLGLETAVTGGDTVTFWNWHFIEEGWDYGFVEALVDGVWVTVPVTDVATGETVSTDDDPHGNNTEGNGITGTSGGAYFVDEPQYLQYSVTVPAGATDLRWRYSTDAAYLDTGWFVDDVAVNGTAATVAPEGDGWVETDGRQDNNWTLQVISSCDLTPGTDSAGEITDGAGNFVYRFTGDTITTPVLDTRCANGPSSDFVVSVSNLPTGDLAVLDASYDFDVVKRSRG